MEFELRDHNDSYENSRAFNEVHETETSQPHHKQNKKGMKIPTVV